MIDKTYEDLKNEIINFVKANYPELNVLDVGDGFADAIINVLAYIYKMDVDNINMLLRFLFIDDMYLLPDADIDNYMLNFNLTRKLGSKAAGTVKFYVYDWGTGDKSIGVGTRVAGRDSSGQLIYEVTGNYNFAEADKGLYWNPSNNRYEVEVSVEAVDIGSRYNISAYVITDMIDDVGFDGVYNDNYIVGGADKETNEEFINRLKQALVFNNVGSRDWYKRIIDEAGISYIDLRVVGKGDDVMIRDNGYGGAVDVYLKVNEGDVDDVSETITVDDLDSDGYYVLQNQPVVNGSVNVSFTGSGNDATYNVYYDTQWQMYGGSVKADNKIQVSYTTAPETIGNIKIDYKYIPKIGDIQALFEDNNRIVGVDVLVKTGEEVLIDMDFDIRLYSDYDFVTVSNDIKNAITNYLYNLGYGVRIEQADLVYIIKSVDGVDNVKLSFNKLAVHGGSGVSDIQLLEYQYPDIGDINIGVF